MKPHRSPSFGRSSRSSGANGIPILIPRAVLELLAVDPLATPASRASIVKAHVGTKVFRLAMAAPTLPARARILLPAITARFAADEAEAA